MKLLVFCSANFDISASEQCKLSSWCFEKNQNLFAYNNISMQTQSNKILTISTGILQVQWAPKNYTKHCGKKNSDRFSKSWLKISVKISNKMM